ncbi:MAG: tRNA pseudouridine(55) synthase TruB, partial [Deferribacterales bacterium]
MTGFINLYKEKGLTSFQNIKKLSMLLGNVKVGHTGTLDPLAEGVLPVCVGEATKLSSYVMAEDKDYVAGIILGYRTDSYDITGKVLQKGVDRVPTIDEIKNIIDKMIGIIELDIPAFSAVNINGERAYKFAREGVIDSAGIRVSRIYKMDLMDYDYPNLIIAVSVEKGTYVRSIVNKIGVMLGTFAVMSSLV